MRSLTDYERTRISQYFDKDKCQSCPYLAKDKNKYNELICGLLEYDCLVTQPECLNHV